MQRRSLTLLTIVVLGFAFLYVPILSMMVYSFNASKLVTVWGGFSTRWYGELLRNRQVLDAAWLSLQVAVVSATGAVILGTFAGVVAARMRRFRGRTVFLTMISAPLVMPEVITGFSLLLLFVTMADLFDWPTRGFTTISLAHITLTMTYVAVVVRARLLDMDASIEEAAMDLGARPAKVFFVIVLPLIAHALVSGWLLAFTLSLDDLVIASFVTGPGATTLPMLIFSKVRLGVSPDINALATLLVATVTLFVVAAGIITARQERARAAAVDP